MNEMDNLDVKLRFLILSIFRSFIFNNPETCDFVFVTIFRPTNRFEWSLTLTRMPSYSSYAVH